MSQNGHFRTIIFERVLIPYRTKIRRTKNSADNNFRRTKFSAPCKIFGTFVRRIYFKKVFAKHLNLPNFRFCNAFYSEQKICWFEEFGGQNFRRTKVSALRQIIGTLDCRIFVL